MATPLTDAINALTRYANETTGASDTNLSDAVGTLVDGFGGDTDYGAMLDGSISGAYENSEITSLRAHALDACSALTSVSFPNVVSVGMNALYNCTNITSMNFPKFKSGGVYSFSNMTKLTSVSLPSAQGSLANFLFSGDKLLKIADIGVKCSGLGGQTFGKCTVLDTVILRRTEGVVSCTNNTFANSPFASGESGGTVYVPSALIESYKAATNWSTILGYENNSIQAIEGSIYETQYADGTPIS